jgi:hypothetical protein
MAVRENTGWGLDGRFLVPALLLLAMAPVAIVPRLDKGLFAALLMALFLVRLGCIDYYWRQLNPRIERIVETLSQLPDGARVYPVLHYAGTADEVKRNMTLQDVPCYVMPDRHIVYPRLWTEAGAQPIRFRHPLPFHIEGQVAEFRTYDYVWTIEPRPEIAAYLAGHADRLSVTEGHALWKLRK